MAEHAHIPSNPSRRRALFGGATAVIVGSGITASVADAIPANPDAELLALRPRLDAAVRDSGYTETYEGPPGLSNEQMEEWVKQDEHGARGRVVGR